MAETFGDLAGGWQPVNETNLYAWLHYGGAGFPPNHDDPDEMAAADEAIQLASAEAAVRLRGTGAPVASIFGLSAIVPQDDDPATAAFAALLYDMFWAPGLGLFRDGVLQVRGREPVERPDLAGAYDLIGFSYYSGMGIAGGRIAIHPPDAPVSPLGYGIWADGVGLVLDRLHEELPGTPLLVAEFGIGSDDDAQRAVYLERGLEVVHDSIARGADVRGLFHWTAVDNYEWIFGFDVAFGILDRDRNVKPSAAVLTRQALGTT
jgi:beta-glucosidase